MLRIRKTFAVCRIQSCDLEFWSLTFFPIDKTLNIWQHWARINQRTDVMNFLMLQIVIIPKSVRVRLEKIRVIIIRYAHTSKKKSKTPKKKVSTSGTESINSQQKKLQHLKILRLFFLLPHLQNYEGKFFSHCSIAVKIDIRTN